MSFARLPDDGRRADYALEVTAEEKEAIVEVIREADRRKRSTKIAREAVGVHD